MPSFLLTLRSALGESCCCLTLEALLTWQGNFVARRHVQDVRKKL
jgi:hypothetical protein